MAETSLFGLAGYGSGSEGGEEEEDEGGVGLVGYGGEMSPAVVDQSAEDEGRQGSPQSSGLGPDLDGPAGPVVAGPAMPGVDPGLTVDTDAEALPEVVPTIGQTLFPDVQIPEAPSRTCDEALQAKIVKYLLLKAQGRSINAELRNLKSYRNPDFLQQCVERWDINQYQSHFPKEVFDPSGLPPEDYYDQIAKEVEKLQEQKAKAAAQAHTGVKRTHIDFSQGQQGVAGGAGGVGAAGRPVVAPNIAGLGASVPASALQAAAMAAAGLAMPAAPAVLGKPSEPHKRSKWDK